MRLAILFALALVGCGPEAGTAPPESPPTEPVAAPAEPAPGSPTTAEPEAPAVEAPTEGTAAAVGEGTTPPADICERARACCRAYVDAIPSARRPLEERGCTQMDEVLTNAAAAADEACEAAIGGWRQSLQLTGIAVPLACQ